MKHILFSLVVLLFVACNNNSTSTATTNVADSATTATNANWSNEGATEFLSNCVGNAMQNGRYKDEKQAYTFCNCILNQIKAKYPNLDSAKQAMEADSTQIVKLQENCK